VVFGFEERSVEWLRSRGAWTGEHDRLCKILDSAHRLFNPWSAFDVIPCRDGKARRVESGSFCLVDGLPFQLADGRTCKGASRPALLRGFGNAIVVPLAVTFIKAYMETGL
jgi:hypothetical protein